MLWLNRKWGLLVSAEHGCDVCACVEKLALKLCSVMAERYLKGSYSVGNLQPPENGPLGTGHPGTGTLSTLFGYRYGHSESASTFGNC